jgi:hypothetical protein
MINVFLYLLLLNLFGDIQVVILFDEMIDHFQLLLG